MFASSVNHEEMPSGSETVPDNFVCRVAFNFKAPAESGKPADMNIPFAAATQSGSAYVNASFKIVASASGKYVNKYVFENMFVKSRPEKVQENIAAGKYKDTGGDASLMMFLGRVKDMIRSANGINPDEKQNPTLVAKLTEIDQRGLDVLRGLEFSVVIGERLGKDRNGADRKENFIKKILTVKDAQYASLNGMAAPAAANAAPAGAVGGWGNATPMAQPAAPVAAAPVAQPMAPVAQPTASAPVAQPVADPVAQPQAAAVPAGWAAA